MSPADHADALDEEDFDIPGEVFERQQNRRMIELPAQSLRPRDQSLKEEPTGIASPPVRIKARGNKALFERRENKLGFGRLVARPETIVSADLAASRKPAESPISIENEMTLPRVGDRERDFKPDYRPNRLVSVLDDTCNRNSMRWLDFLDGRMIFLMGTFTLICVGAALVWRFYGTVQDQPDDRVPPPSSRPVEERIQLVKSAVDNFLKAKEVEDRLPMVLEPERTKPRMSSYYTARQEPDPVINSFTVGEPAGQDGQAWFPVTFTEASGTEFTLTVEETATGCLVDWENFVAYGEVSWSKFCATPSSESVAQRVRVTPGSGYEQGFDEKHHQCYLVEHRSGGPSMKAYVERNTRTGAKMEELTSAKEPQFLHLYLKFATADPRSPLVIEDIVQSSWRDSQVRWSKPGESKGKQHE